MILIHHIQIPVTCSGYCIYDQYVIDPSTRLPGSLKYRCHDTLQVDVLLPLGVLFTILEICQICWHPRTLKLSTHFHGMHDLHCNSLKILNLILLQRRRGAPLSYTWNINTLLLQMVCKFSLKGILHYVF